MSIKKEIGVLCRALKKDQPYYWSWQSNIAMAFYDEMLRRGYNLPDLRDISNKAAINFLDLLMRSKPSMKKVVWGTGKNRITL